MSERHSSFSILSLRQDRCARNGLRVMVVWLRESKLTTQEKIVRAAKFEQPV